MSDREEVSNLEIVSIGSLISVQAAVIADSLKNLLTIVSSESNAVTWGQDEADLQTSRVENALRLVKSVCLRAEDSVSEAVNAMQGRGDA